MVEVWKDVVGFEGYKVSNYGKVKTVKFGRDSILHTSLARGYPHVTLYKNGIKNTKSVHRIVAEAFIPNTNNLPQVDHIDGNRANAALSNLRWCTAKENQNFEIAQKKRIYVHILKEGKPIVQYSLKGEFINRWNSVSTASRTLGITREGIRDCCLGKQKTAFGFVWKYVEESQ